MSADIPYMVGFLAATTGDLNTTTVAAILGAIWVGIQILDRLSPKMAPELKALIETTSRLTEVTSKLTEEVHTLTGTVNAAVKLSDERFARVLDQLRESRG